MKLLFIIMTILTCLNAYSYSYRFSSAMEFKKCYEFSVQNLSVKMNPANMAYVQANLIVKNISSKDCSSYIHIKIRDIAKKITLDDNIISDFPQRGERKIVSFDAYLPENSFNNSTKLDIILR